MSLIYFLFNKDKSEETKKKLNKIVSYYSIDKKHGSENKRKIEKCRRINNRAPKKYSALA